MKTSTKKRKLKSLNGLEDCANNNFLMRREQTMKANNDKLVSLGLPPMIPLIAQPARLPSLARLPFTSVKSALPASIRGLSGSSNASIPASSNVSHSTPSASIPASANVSHSTPTVLVSRSNLRQTNSSLGGGSLVEIPTYEQIFWPPSQRFKEPGKLYGKAVLRRFFYSQYLTLMTNKRIMKGWLVDADLFDNPPNLKDPVGAAHLRELIDAKESNLAALNFGSVTYRMLPRDIYGTLKEMLHYAKRKLCQDAQKNVGAQNVHEGEYEDGQGEEVDAAGGNSSPVFPGNMEIQDDSEQFSRKEFNFGDTQGVEVVFETQFFDTPTVEENVTCSRKPSLRRNGKLKRTCPDVVVTRAPPALSLELVEKLVIDSFGYTDVDDMYANIRDYMKKENQMSKKKVFVDLKNVSDEEAVRLVAKYLMQG